MIDALKKILIMAGGLAIGISAGILISGLFIVLFTDASFSEFLLKFEAIAVSELAIAVLASLAGFLISLFVIVTLHEAGHLVCGLYSGYKFVSFRIFNLTFIRIDGKMRVKRFAIAGTGGQCLLSPPDLPIEKIPTALYNAGGILANLLLLFISVFVLCTSSNPYVTEVMAIFVIVDLLFIIINGVPMKLGGVANDAYNMIHLRKNPLSKQAFMTQLRSNALIQDGIRPKDMPAGWFEWETDIDYRNALEVSIPLMYASRKIDEMEWSIAYEEFEELYGHKSELMQLYVNEIACELAFCAMITGRLDEAEKLLDSKLRKYIEAYKKVMSSKMRVLCAVALYIDNDRDKAESIYKSLEASKDKYLLQGEVKSDLAIMERMLDVPL